MGIKRSLSWSTGKKSITRTRPPAVWSLVSPRFQKSSRAPAFAGDSGGAPGIFLRAARCTCRRDPGRAGRQKSTAPKNGAGIANRSPRFAIPGRGSAITDQSVIGGRRLVRDNIGAGGGRGLHPAFVFRRSTSNAGPGRRVSRNSAESAPRIALA